MNFTTVILAGGQSRRMGQDKARVLYAGEPLWQRQLATIRRLTPTPSEVLISGRPNGPYWEAELPIIEDEVPGCGPLGGLVTVLATAVNDFVLVLGIDLPLVGSEFLSGLLSEAAAAGVGVVPSGAGKFQPLAAIYTRACLPVARECLVGEDRSMQRFIREAVKAGLLRERPLLATELPMFRNVNTPRDLDVGE